MRTGTIPLPPPLKQRIKDALVALSLANLCFLKVSFDLVSDYDRFFNKVLVTPPQLAALGVNVFGLGLVIWLVMQLLRRFPNRWLQVPAHLACLVLLVYPVDFIRIKFSSLSDYQIIAFMKQPVMLGGELVLLALILWQHRRIARTEAIVLGILSPLAIFMFSKVALICLGLSHLQQCASAPLPPPGPVRAGQPRVVWIIFDETDYRLAFEQRPAGLQLPEFDRLRQESLSAVNAYSPGNYTLFSMSALIIGKPLADVWCADTCDLTVKLADTGSKTNWSSLPSVFSEARALGVNTALVGWYLPYERELPGALNFCAWYPYPAYEPSRAATFGAAVWQQLDSLTETFHLRRLFIKVHRDSLQAALGVVTNSTYGLTLLHLPAPHKPGIYLPDQDRFTVWFMSQTQGYFNNLVLADHELGQLRHAMETTGKWDQTWIILSSDHAWRWSDGYDGKHDFRVPFIVKSPGKNEPRPYAKPFNTILTHDLILALLKGEITNQPDVASWLDVNGKPLMTDQGWLHE